MAARHLRRQPVDDVDFSDSGMKCLLVIFWGRFASQKILGIDHVTCLPFWKRALLDF
jgi:hypothetical protein